MRHDVGYGTFDQARQGSLQVHMQGMCQVGSKAGGTALGSDYRRCGRGRSVFRKRSRAGFFGRGFDLQQDGDVFFFIQGVGENGEIFCGIGAVRAAVHQCIGAGKDGAGHDEQVSALAEIEKLNGAAIRPVLVDALAGGQAVLFIAADHFHQGGEALVGGREFAGEVHQAFCLCHLFESGGDEDGGFRCQR